MDIGLTRDEVAKILSDSSIQSPFIVNAVYKVIDANNRALEKYLMDRGILK